MRLIASLAVLAAVVGTGLYLVKSPRKTAVVEFADRDGAAVDLPASRKVDAPIDHEIEKARFAETPQEAPGGSISPESAPAVESTPAIDSEDLAPLRIYVESVQDVEDLEGIGTWDPERLGRIPAFMTLYALSDSQLDLAMAFYEKFLVESTGRSVEELNTNAALRRDVDAVKEAWLLFTSLQRKHEACTARINDRGMPQSIRDELKVRRQTLEGLIATALARVSQISKKFYDRYQLPPK
ncbi:MAG TPA: hypothetical protein VEI02_09255 [Planctomycetota bacterium]|nr:hypothetical protein [Planctomycetota bacterium]